MSNLHSKCWWSFRALLPSLGICPVFPTGKPSIKTYDHLLDQIGIYIEGMCLSAFSFFLSTKEKTCDDFRNVLSLEHLCDTFFLDFLTPFSPNSPDEVDLNPGFHILVNLLKLGLRLLDFVAKMKTGETKLIFQSLRVQMLLFSSSRSPYRQGLLDLFFNSACHPNLQTRMLIQTNFVLGKPFVPLDQLVEFVNDEIQNLPFDVGKSNADAPTIRAAIGQLNFLRDCNDVVSTIEKVRRKDWSKS